ncbi:alkylglycerol monooxygenase-like [Panulirus ornatus]|uniref:alkylglycerol monooxygenase-like n=1 Tax=Panulirus ornatus TaxID=150431 RepID=UPI003A86651A
MSALHRLGTLFYVISPNSSTFQHVEEVPNYTNQAVPLFITFLALEWIVTWFDGEKRIRHNDFITSIMHGVLYEVIGVVIRSFTLCGYGWLYERRLVDPDWSSPVTWWVAAIGVDFGYYWFHRATHEINLMWANHQVHHSSEEYNLSTALRQSTLQQYFSFGFYQPLALLGVPLPALLVHLQFNLLFQFWIHTEVVKNCGPLEWVLNTPSHHRVHHGSNKWCLDKNYAGVFILWDRIFGTFQAERDDEKIAYGLVDQPQSFNVVWLQFYYLREVFRKACSMTTWVDTLKALFYGPGWFPGTPRLGDPDALPDTTPPRVKYDPQLPLWQEIYVLGHFLVILLIHQTWITKISTFSWLAALLFMGFVFLSAGIIGAMYDGWWWAPLVEAARCIAYIAYARSMPVTGLAVLDTILIAYFAISTLLWTSQSIAVVKASIKAAKLD